MGGILNRKKLKFKVHNPNSVEATAKYITNIFVDVGVQKLEKAVEKKVQDSEIAVMRG